MADKRNRDEPHHRPTREQLDERHSIALEPELAIEALLKVKPDAPEAKTPKRRPKY